MTSQDVTWDMTSSVTMGVSLFDNVTSYNASVNVSGNASEFGDLSSLFSDHRPVVANINRYLTPLWYIVGFPGNTLAFLVWIRRRMRPSSGCYLSALAANDLMFLIFQMVFELHMEWGVAPLDFPGICEIFPVLFYTTQYLSPMLVLGFTVERYISICHPFKRERYCSTRRAIMVIVGLIVLCLGLSLIQGYFMAYSSEAGICDVRPSVVVGGARSLWSVWSWITELLVFGVVPVGILVLNGLVINETRRMKKSEEKRLCLQKGYKTASGPSATTFMLLAVSFYLIFTTLPVTLLYALQLNFPMGDPTMTYEAIANDPTWQRHLDYFSIRVVVQELAMSHYALNFYIYLMTGRMFRRELKRMLCCGRGGRRWSDSMNGNHGNSATTVTRVNGKASHV